MEGGTVYLILAGVFGLYMAWGIGANDVANAMATSVGSKVLTLRNALIVAAIFEFLGAVLAGGGVTSTIRKGIIDVSSISGEPETLILGMLGSLLAAATWLNLASRWGWPVSTTHSIVGAIVGFGMVGIGTGAVKWGGVATIASSWVISPVVAGAVAFMLFKSVQYLVLDRPDPLAQARRWVPAYMFLAGFMISAVTLTKGIKNLGFDLSLTQDAIYSTFIGIAVAGIGAYFISKIKVDPSADREFRFHTVDRVFAVLMVLTACTMAFAHGSNDVANAIGPVAAIVSAVTTGTVEQKAGVSIWMLLLGGAGILIGLATFGRHVMATVGEGITHLTPSRGFAAELAAASTVVVASATGMPVSTTHTLVGAVLGVGIARGIAAINLGVVRNIFLSWIITVPAGALLSVVFYFILKAILT